MNKSFKIYSTVKKRKHWLNMDLTRLYYQWQIITIIQNYSPREKYVTPRQGPEGATSPACPCSGSHPWPRTPWQPPDPHPWAHVPSPARCSVPGTGGPQCSPTALLLAGGWDGRWLPGSALTPLPRDLPMVMAPKNGICVPRQLGKVQHRLFGGPILPLAAGILSVMLGRRKETHQPKILWPNGVPPLLPSHLHLQQQPRFSAEGILLVSMVVFLTLRPPGEVSVPFLEKFAHLLHHRSTMWSYTQVSV